MLARRLMAATPSSPSSPPARASGWWWVTPWQCASPCPSLDAPLAPPTQVYFQSTCQKHELVCTLREEDFPQEVSCITCPPCVPPALTLPLQDVEKRGVLITRMVAGLQLDAESNKPMLIGDIPVTWVAK